MRLPNLAFETRCTATGTLSPHPLTENEWHFIFVIAKGAGQRQQGPGSAHEVTNLTDKYDYLTINDQSIGGQGHTNAQPGRPREWAVSVKKKF
jgi:hypothetical protein